MKFLESKNNSHSFYMVLEKLLLTIANFAVFAVIARKLGANNIGIFSLTQAFLLIGLPISLFLNEQLLIRYTLDKCLNINSIFKHAVLLKLLFSILTYFLGVALAYYFYGEELAKYVSIYCLIYFLNFDLLFFAYFRAHRNGRLVFRTKMLINIPFAIIKIATVTATENLLLLFVVYAIEALLLGVFASYLFYRARDNQNFLSEKLSHEYLSKLIKSSTPLICSAVVITLYSRVDQFMIKNILGSEALGQYAVGVKLSEASTFLLAAYLASRFPSLLKIRSESKANYNTQIVKYLNISLILGLSMFAGMVFVSRPVVSLLFGEQYLPASSVLVIHMFGAIFIYYGMICTQWLIAEGLEFYRLIRVLVGLVLNIVLNYFWIEQHGILGAATATVISQVGSNVLFNAFSKKTRPFFELELLSFNPRTLIKNMLPHK